MPEQNEIHSPVVDLTGFTKTVIVLPNFLGKDEADKVRAKIEAQRKATGLVLKDMPLVEYAPTDYSEETP